MIQTRQLEVKNSALASFLLNMRNPPETLRFRGKFSKKKQIAGIEPVSPAWEASVLPMNYICMSVSITQTLRFEKRKIKLFFR